MNQNIHENKNSYAGFHKIFFVREHHFFEKKLSVKVRNIFATKCRKLAGYQYSVCHGQSVSVMDSLWLSQPLCVCHRKYFITYKYFFGQFPCRTWTEYTWFCEKLSMRFEFVREQCSRRSRLCGPLDRGAQSLIRFSISRKENLWRHPRSKASCQRWQ